MRGRWRWLFVVRNHLAGAPLIWALLTTKGQSAHRIADWAAAVSLCLAGVGVRAWSSSHCGYGRTRPPGLARTGPYGLVRNPLYLGNLLIILGATFASEVVWLAPLALGWAFAVYALTVSRYEEPMMRARYGEAWRRYRAEVPAWLPALHRAPIGGHPILAQLPPQATRLLWLLPFALKEARLFGLGGR